MLNRRELLASACAASALVACRNVEASGDTAFIDGLLAPGGDITIPVGNYVTEFVRPRSGSVITIEPGTTFTRASSPFPVLELKNVEDVHIAANGATFDGRQGAALSSHTVSMLGARRCSLADPYVLGTKGAKDGVYLGLGDSECYDSHIIGGSIDGAGRNGLSFIAAIRCSLDGTEVFGTQGAPGAGVVVEANNHSYLNIENTIANGHFHHNAGAGALVSFGDRTTIKGILSEHNKRGVQASSGGATRKVGVYRNNVDVMGVVSFDPATGLIKVGGRLDLLRVGSVVSFVPRNGASLPAPLKSQLYTVTSHGPDNEIRVGSAVDYQEFTSFKSGGSGTLSANPDFSDITLSVFGGFGQSFGTRIIDNVCQYNTKDGVYAAIHGGLEVVANDADSNGARQYLIKGCHGAVVTDNDALNGASDGMLIASCHGASVRRNNADAVDGYGIYLSGSSGSELLNNTIGLTGLDPYRVASSANVLRDF